MSAADVFPADRLPPQSKDAEKGVIGGVLRQVYLRFALYTAWLAVAMLIASLVFGLIPRST